MLNKSKMRRFLSLGFAAAAFLLASGHLAGTHAQNRDPFAQPDWKKQKNRTQGGPQVPVKKGPPPVMPVSAPAIEARIAYYKQLRESAASSGMPIPKVTSVLTLDEMSVTGIFRTPRGFAAMVEATPIKLSYTIYPGEKFFDGQLVAIEENRLTFRRVVKMSNGKFVASVENKGLRQYSIQEQLQGTAPVEIAPAKTEVANTAPTGSTAAPNQPAAPAKIVSPVDEMNNQPADAPESSSKEKDGKKTKKSPKVAKKSE